ncbi:MAG: alpha-amylase family glycosyl hydrolase, partial [Flavobacteriaceae bacterium]
FYYVPNTEFKVPEWQDSYLPLGGEESQFSTEKFIEVPAKWTGNGSRLAQPHFNDWYETVKVNYGIRPDGTKDFVELPEEFEKKDYKDHFEFWENNNVPDSWNKFRNISHYWLDLGVDGFRFDMAEMVPVEFWSYLNSSIKMKKQDAFLLAEVYNPGLYRDYIYNGKMDYLYDKVELYDGIKHIIKGYGWTDHIPVVQKGLEDIEHHMLHFLENHDEQRIASPDFAGNATLAKPAMVVSATISTSPTMIYFGQELGERANEEAGYGRPTRTSIFDYIGVPSHQRWVNNKKFDGGQLSFEEQQLRDFYKRLLNFTIHSEALMGSYEEIHFYNKEHTEHYNHRVLSYVRWSNRERLIIITNFDADISHAFDLKIPETIIKKWNLKDGEYRLKEELYHQINNVLLVVEQQGTIKTNLEPLASVIFSIVQ